MIDKISTAQLQRALEVSREPRKLTWYKTIISETVPWLDTSVPIHEAHTPTVTIQEEDDGAKHIRVEHGTATLTMRVGNDGRGDYWYVDTPMDDFYYNCAGLSTSQRGPLHDISHIYHNRGTAWGVAHKDNDLGYAMYLTYQISHELKKELKRL